MPCLKGQSSDLVDELLVGIRIFIGSEGLWLKVQERSLGEHVVARRQIIWGFW
jgi:hypothetical protein